MSDKKVEIDDSDFKEVRERWKAKTPGDPSVETGFDIAGAQALRQRRKEEVFERVRAELSALTEEAWFAYQHLSGIVGEPAYLFRLELNGLASLDPEGGLQIATTWLFLVTSHDSNPATANVRCLMDLTPMWHPQTDEDGQVVLAPWRPATWGDLVEILQALVRYGKYDTEEFVLNPAAAAWAREHADQLPIE